MSKKPRFWVTPTFKQVVYELKAEDPDKTIDKILDDIASRERERRKKRGGNSVFPSF